MPDKFEKQVQDKMNELQFQPSAPVWKAVETQIRRRKERRRLLFWLPLFALLLTGGLWWNLSYTGGQQTTAVPQPNTAPAIQADEPENNKEQKNDVTLQKHNRPATLPQPGNNTLTITKPAASITQALTKKEKTATGIKTAVAPTGISVSFNPASSFKNRKNMHAEKRMALSTPSKRSSRNPTPGYKDETTIKNATKPDETSSVTAIVAQAPAAGNTDDSAARLKPKNNDTTATKSDTVHTRPAAPSPLKKAAPAWKVVWQVSAGASGLASGLNLFGTKKLAEQLYAIPGIATPPAASQRGPSVVKNGWGFAIGAAAERRLSNRLRFSVGLQYQYFSNRLVVGRFSVQDSTVQGGRPVNNFYSNSGTDFGEHTNRFHFLALPVSLQWQVHRNQPLYLEAGLALQQLLSAQALLYDAGSNIYYKDNDQLNRMQVAALLGVQYRLLQMNGIVLAAGPQLQYGLQQQDKTGSGKHLFQVGLGLRIRFEKNK